MLPALIKLNHLFFTKRWRLNELNSLLIFSGYSTSNNISCYIHGKKLILWIWRNYIAYYEKIYTFYCCWARVYSSYSFVEEVFPELLKQAIMKPLHNKGNADSLGKYCPFKPSQFIHKNFWNGFIDEACSFIQEIQCHC